MRSPRAPRRSTRTFSRTLRVNEIVREVLADELERMNDPRLEMVTLTSVDVSPDLRSANVYYGALGRELEDVDAGLRAAASHLRAALGRQVRLKYLPRLEFHHDPALETGQRVEEIIREMHRNEGQ